MSAEESPGLKAKNKEKQTSETMQNRTDDVLVKKGINSLLDSYLLVTGWRDEVECISGLSTTQQALFHVALIENMAYKVLRVNYLGLKIIKKV